jgi:FAD dependent oxidoreductase
MIFERSGERDNTCVDINAQASDDLLENCRLHPLDAHRSCSGIRSVVSARNDRGPHGKAPSGFDGAEDVQAWCGLRPMTPDGRPIIGWSTLNGLFLNTGHGMLGWTLACGSARLTAQLIEKKALASLTSAFRVDRHIEFSMLS